MDKKTLKSGVFEVEVTLYKTGNVHLKIMNKLTMDVDNVNVRKKKDSTEHRDLNIA